VTEVDRPVGASARAEVGDLTRLDGGSVGAAVVERRIAGRWRLDALLGQGGMADVYRAVDVETGAPVALKLLRSPDPLLARRLANEARTLESFNHPNLVRLLGTGTDGGCAYLVTELVEGPTLAATLRHGPLRTATVAAMGAALAGALGYVHSRGVVHRDIKPANVLLGPRSRVRLADFGIARLVEEVSMTATGSTIGTTAYMAPEQLHNHEVGSPADVYSLGMVLLESLRGVPSFTGTAGEIVARRLASPLRAPRDLPLAWQMLLDAMLEEDPERRPSAAEVEQLIVAPAYEAPWSPPPGRTGHMAPSPVVGPDPAGTAGARTELAGRTAAIRSAPRRDRQADIGRWRLMIAGLIVAMAALAVVAWLLSGPGGSGTNHPTRHRAVVSRASTVPTSARKPTVAAAAATLLRDEQDGISSGSLLPGLGVAILGDLDQVLTAVDQGNLAGIGPGLGAIDAAIAGGASSGEVTAHEASILTEDVSALAALLKAPTIATTTTTTTAPPPPPPPSHHGHGGGG
jgi:hypothetical protein